MDSLRFTALFFLFSSSLIAQLDHSLDSIYYYNHSETGIQLVRSDIVSNKNDEGRILESKRYGLNSSEQLTLTQITAMQWEQDLKTQEMVWRCFPVVDTCVLERIIDFFQIGESSITQTYTNFNIYDDGAVITDSLSLLRFLQVRDSLVINDQGHIIKKIQLVSETPDLWTENSTIEYFWDSTIPRVDSTYTFDELGILEERSYWNYNLDGTFKYSLRVASDGRIINLHRQTYDENGLLITVKRSSSLEDTTYAEVKYDGIFRTNEWYVLTASGDTLPTSISEIIYLDEERIFLDSITNYRWVDTLSQFTVNNSRKYYYTNDMTSIEELNKVPNYSIYPNPASDYIIVQNLAHNASLESNFKLFDTNGILVKERNLNSKITRINLNNVLPGSYFLKIGEESIFRLLIIQSH